MSRNVEKHISDGKQIMRQGRGWKDINLPELTKIIETGTDPDGKADLSKIAQNAFYFGAAVAKRTADQEPKKDATDTLRKWKRQQEARTLITMKAARVAAGLTQQELADRIGVSIRTVRACENGERDATPEYVHYFAHATGFCVDDLEL